MTDKYIEKKDVNKYVIIYGYLFFKEIDKAKKIIENMIEEKENSNNKNEKIMWDNFILGIIEALEIIYIEDSQKRRFNKRFYYLFSTTIPVWAWKALLYSFW